MKRRAFLRLTGFAAAAVAAAPMLPFAPAPFVTYHVHPASTFALAGNFRVGDVITFADHGQRYVITGCVGPTMTVRRH